MAARAQWQLSSGSRVAALLCVVAALLCAVELVACSRDYDVSFTSSVSDINPLLPLPVDVEALRVLLHHMRLSPPHSAASYGMQPTSLQHLAASRANAFGRPHEADAPGWLSLIVHFSSPVHSATLAALAEAADGVVTASLGSGVFAVSCVADAVHRIRRFPGVSSVRLRSPAEKLRVTGAHQAAEGGPVHIHSRCMPPSQPCSHRIASVLETHGCSVSSSQAPHHKTMGVCPARNAAAAAAAVAALQGVDWVEEVLPFVSHDFSCNRILWSQNESSITNASRTALDTPLNGSGQLIAIADTGLDLGNCFFHYGQSVSSANANTRIDAGNVHTYWTMDSCEQCGNCPRACSDFIDFEGHGTHVAGIAAGRANVALAGSSAAAANNGLAVGASLFFQDISASVGLITPPIHLQQLFAPAYAAGARVHSNSWGCSGNKPTDCNVYSLAAREVDAFMFNHPDFLVVFAAGNAGSSDSSMIGTVSSPATCKNCLSVGSSNIGIEDAVRSWQHTSALDMCKPRYGEGVSPSLSPCCSAAADSAAGSLCSLLMLSCCPWDEELLCCSDEARATNNNGKSKLKTSTLSQFSSVGPTRDGRLKPDVVAPGHMIASANAHNAFSGAGTTASCAPPPSASATNVDWNARAVQLMSGTSMAAPAIAAVAAIVRQWFQEGWYPSGSPDSNSSINPSSALVRAVIAASAAALNSDSSSSARPSVKSGFGLPSLARALYIRSVGGSHRIAVVDASSVPTAGSASVAHGAHNVVTAACSGGKVIAALSWTDPPGHPSASLQLVNDLDLLVWSKGEQDAAPVLHYGNGDSVADSRNNLETVATSCAAGSTVTAAVYGAVVLSPLQFYALVLSGAVSQSTLAAVNASEKVIQAATAGRSVQVMNHRSLTHRFYALNPFCRALEPARTPPTRHALPAQTAADQYSPASCSKAATGRRLAPALTRTSRSLLPLCCASPCWRVPCTAGAIPSSKLVPPRLETHACAFTVARPDPAQVRFACDVSIGLDFHLAETRAVQTLNFLLVRCSFSCSDGVQRRISPLPPGARAESSVSGRRLRRPACAWQRLPALL
jgi:subtilisin family serine protease